MANSQCNLIEFISDFRGVSGYGNACRSSLRAMIDAGLNVKLSLNAHDKNSPVFDSYWSENNKLQKMLDDGKLDKRTPDVRIWCQTPNWFKEVDLEDGVYNIGWTLWETSKILDFDLAGNQLNNWVSQMNKCDEVWTSCSFSKKVFEDCGVTSPVHVVGHPRDWTKYKKQEVKDKFLFNGVNDDAFKFLAVSQWTPRKGFKELISAYLCEFNSKDNTNLVLKTYRANFDEAADIIQEIKRVKTGINKNSSEFPKISLLFQNVPEEEMPLLYNMCDCFILPTKGEGFGMPLVEAMGSEMVCITPDHTAMKDYVSDDNAMLLKNWQPECIVGMGGMYVYQDDQYWYQCNTKEIREKMREAYEMDENSKGEMGSAARETVTSMYSFEVLGKEMKRLIENAMNNKNDTEFPK